MSFRTKLILLTVIPMLLGMASITFWVTRSAQKLSASQAQEFKLAFTEHRKEQLRDYVEIVQSTVSHLNRNDDTNKDGNLTPPKPRDLHPEDAAVLVKLLSKIEFSEDGYFYVYDTDGTNVVHPRQPYRVGKNWLNLTDQQGKEVIKGLLERANEGGGYTEYLWEKPSTGYIAKKIGYSELLGNSQWMIGTGAYFDDIDAQVNDVQNAIAPAVQKTFVASALIAAAAVMIVFASGLLLQLNEKRLADSKLRELTRRIVLTQDEERRRVSRELHDSISQSLVGLKYLLEDIEATHTTDPQLTAQRIEKGIANLDQTLNEVRQISRDLHPSVLDDIGLMAAVEALVDGFRQRTSIDVSFNNVQVRHLLPQEARTALYRVVQEALTNIERHSHASEASIKFGIHGKWFGVTINDNGIGFDANEAQFRQRARYRGIGLRNISERLHYLNGVCKIVSDTTGLGTQGFAGIPKSMLRRSHGDWENA